MLNCFCPHQQNQLLLSTPTDEQLLMEAISLYDEPTKQYCFERERCQENLTSHETFFVKATIVTNMLCFVENMFVILRVRKGHQT